MLDLLPFVASGNVQCGIVGQLEKASGRAYGENLNGWYEWLWSIDPGEYPDYAEFKTSPYAQLDRRFCEYFENRPKSIIRLDEIRWGGVRRDSIPPLQHPKLLAARGRTNCLV